MNKDDRQFLELETDSGRRIRVLHAEHPRARRLSLTVGADGPRVSSPRGVHPVHLKAFLRENLHWLERKLRELERLGQRLAAPTPGRRDSLLWRGERLPVRWEHNVFPRIRVDDGVITFALDLEHPDAQRIEQRAVRSFILTQMKREVAAMVAELEPAVGKPVRSTRLLPMKSLWGSLSISGRMTLDLALMLAPPAAMQYVVAHEMCHLWVRNHGKRFWERVEAVHPDFEADRHWLSKYGHVVKAELARWIGSELD